MFKRLEDRLARLDDLIGAKVLVPPSWHVYGDWTSANVRTFTEVAPTPKSCAWCGGLPPRCCHSEKW